MKFTAPRRGTREAVDLTDDNSDNISTDDLSTPPEYNQTFVLPYEVITYGPDDGIILYPYDSIPPKTICRPPQIEESEDDEEVEIRNIDYAIATPSYVHFESEERDLLTIENLQNLRDRLNDYANENLVNPATHHQASPAMNFENTPTNNDTTDHEQTRSSMNISSLPTDTDSHLFLPPPARPSTPNN